MFKKTLYLAAISLFPILSFAQSVFFQAPAPNTSATTETTPMKTLSPEDFRKQVNAKSQQNQVQLNSLAGKAAPLPPPPAPSPPPPEDKMTTPPTPGEPDETTIPEKPATVKPTAPTKTTPIPPPPTTVEEPAPSTNALSNGSASQPYTGFAPPQPPANSPSSTGTKTQPNSGWNVKY